MVDERVTTRDDGVVTEQVVERRDDAPERVYVERSGGSGVLIGLLVLVALAVAAWFLLAQNNSEVAKDTAIADAVQDTGAAVSDAANKVGDAAQDAANGN